MNKKKTLIAGILILALVISMVFFLSGDNKSDDFKAPEYNNLETVDVNIVIKPTEEEKKPLDNTFIGHFDTGKKEELEDEAIVEEETGDEVPAEPEKDFVEDENKKPEPKPIVKFEDCKKTMYVTSLTLNVRSGPGTDYHKVGIFAQGEYVRVIGIGDNGWFKILFNDKIAYCAGNYLEDLNLDENDKPLIEIEVPETTV